jgi:transcriptional regulator with XRE-family HTH domain
MQIHKERNMEFNENLKNIRATLALTQDELSERSGLKPAAISHFETGKREPSLKNIIRLCRALGCSPNALIHLD